MTQRLSVSLPDELWARTKAKRTDISSTSELVQTALEEWTRPADSAGFSLERPEDVDEKFNEALGRLASLARAQFEEGYRAALELAPVLDWWSLQGLAEDDFDVKGWAQGLANSRVSAEMGRIPAEWAADSKVVGGLLKALRGWIHPWGDDMERPTMPFVRGFTKALRELWEMANYGESAVDIPSPASVSEYDKGGASGQ